jgi:hypothetical protein
LDLSSDTYTHQSGLWHLTTYKDFGGGGYSKHYYFQPFVGLIGLWTAILTYLFFTFQLKIHQRKKISLILIPLILYIFLIIIHQYIDKPRWLG